MNSAPVSHRTASTNIVAASSDPNPAPAHCRRVSGPYRCACRAFVRDGVPAGAGICDEAGGGGASGPMGSAVEPDSVCEISREPETGATTGSLSCSGANPASGHGSPPVARGRPRRRGRPDAVTSAVFTGALAVVTVSAGCTAGDSVATWPWPGVATWSWPDEVSIPIAASTRRVPCVGAGHGSPPGTRGRPRRSIRVSGCGVDAAAMGDDVDATATGAVCSATKVAAGGSAGCFGLSATGGTPAGGHGSPPCRRGNPRRMLRAYVAMAV